MTKIDYKVNEWVNNTFCLISWGHIPHLVSPQPGSQRFPTTYTTKSNNPTPKIKARTHKILVHDIYHKLGQFQFHLLIAFEKLEQSWKISAQPLLTGKKRQKACGKLLMACETPLCQIVHHTNMQTAFTPDIE